MKKMKRIVAAMLAMTLMVSTALTSQAIVVVDGDTKQQTNFMQPSYYVDSNTKAKTYAFMADSDTGVVQLKLNKGNLSYAFASATNNGISTVYADAACTRAISGSQINLAYQLMDNEMYMGKATFAVPATGTYYVKYTNLTAGQVGVMSMEGINGADRDLNNTTLVSFSNGNQKTIFYKVAVPKTGYIDLNTYMPTGTASVYLCNSGKKAISKATTVSAAISKRHSVYAVNKGTYYVRVDYTGGEYAIQKKFTAVSEKSGKTKKKAKTIKYKKTYNGLLALSDKGGSKGKSDWYKVVLKKKSKMKITVRGSVTGGSLKYEFSAPKMKKKLKHTFSGYGFGSRITMSYSYGSKKTKTLPKGTYYIRIYKSNKSVTGTYSLKVTK